jgi:hypothetical protein
MEEDKVYSWNSSQYFELRPITKHFYEFHSSVLYEKFVSEFSSHEPTRAVLAKMHLLNLYSIIL